MRLRLGDVPVSVRWSFWLVTILIMPLPYRLLLRAPAYRFVIAWVVVVFVTVLLHEFAHAFTVRRTGASPAITLYFLGGFTAWDSDDLSPGRRAWIAASGALAGFVLGGSTWLALELGLVPADQPVLVFALEELWYVNLVWGALNLLPLRPLDGGHVVAAALESWFGRRGMMASEALFPITALAATGWSIANGHLLLAAFGILLVLVEVGRWRRGEPAVEHSG